MEEIWRDIPGYEGLYQASNLGHIKALEAKRPMKYESGMVRLKDRKGVCRGYMVARVILMTFKPVVGGIHRLCAIRDNDDPTDNRLENLKWLSVTAARQISGARGGASPKKQTRIRGMTHPSAKLTDDQVRAIRCMRKEGASQPEIARCFNVSKDIIGRVVRGETWKHVV